MDNSNDDTALVPVKVRPPTSLVPRTQDLESISRLSRAIMDARGQMFPKELDSPAKVFAVMAYGLEVGVPPMAALRNIYVVNGKPQPSAELMAGIVQASDTTVTFEILELTADKCTMRIKRPSRNVVGEYTYTIEDAKRANLVKPGNPWGMYPKDMLRHATMKRLCRAYAPDLINGLDTAVALSPVDDEPPSYIDGEFIDDEAPAPVRANVDPETGEITDEPEDAEFTESDDDPTDEAPDDADDSAPVDDEAQAAAVAWLDEAAQAAGFTREGVLAALDADVVAVASDLAAHQARWAEMLGLTAGGKAGGKQAAKSTDGPKPDGVKSRPMLIAYAKQALGLDKDALVKALELDAIEELDGIAQAEGGWPQAAEHITARLSEAVVA